MKIKRKYVVIGGLLVAIAGLAALALRPTVFDVETALVERGPMQVTIDEDGITRYRAGDRTRTGDVQLGKETGLRRQERLQTGTPTGYVQYTITPER